MLNGEPANESVEARLLRLERNNKWLLRSFLFLVLGVVIFALSAAAPRANLPIATAEEFRLVDADGNQRAVIGLANNLPFLSFSSDSGTPTIEIGIKPEGPIASFKWPDGRGAMEFGVKQGQPGVAFYDQSGTPRAFLALTSDGSGVALRDEKGNVRGSFGISKNGSATLSLFDVTGRALAVLGANEQESALTLLAPASSAGLSLKSISEGSGLHLWDSNKTTRAEFALKQIGSSVILRDETGAVIFSEPKEQH